MNYIIITSLIAFFEHIVGRGRNADFYELEVCTISWDQSWYQNETIAVYVRRHRDEERELQVLFEDGMCGGPNDGRLGTLHEIEHPGFDNVDAVLTKFQEMYPDSMYKRTELHIPHWDQFTNPKGRILKEEAVALWQMHLDQMEQLALYEPSPYEQDDCDFMAEKEAEDAEWREVDRADHPDQYEDPDALPF